MATDTQGPKRVDRFLALIGVAMGIALFLATKTPLIVVVLLLAMFAVLFHVVWNFWWIEKSQARRIISLTILAALLFVFGVFVWPPKVELTAPPPPSNWTLLVNSFSSSTAGYIAFVGGLPWYWIVPSFTVGALVAALAARRRRFSREKEWRNREEELQSLVCREPQLHALKADDKDRIKELVRVAGIHYQPEFGKAYIDFVFSVFNNSLFDIVIDNTIKKGAILFGEDWDKFHYDPHIESDHPILCRSRAANYFVIRQAVRAEEIVRFTSENLLISFDNLEITFRGTEQSLAAARVDVPLDLHHYLETKKRVWRALDHLEFIFGYTAEQWGKLQEKPKETTLVTSQVKKLDVEKSMIDQLPPQVIRAKINLKGGSFAIEEHHHYDETLPLDTVGSQMVIARFRYMPDAGDETSIRVRGCVTYKNHGNSIESKTVWRGYGRETKTFLAGDRNDLILACTLPTEDGPTALCQFAYKVSLDPDGNLRDVVPQITALPGSSFLVTVELILSHGDVVVSTPSFRFNLNMDENVGIPKIAIAE